METKVCMRCHESKRITSFKGDKRMPDGRTKTCRPCYTNNKLDRFIRTPEQIESQRKKMLGRKYSVSHRLAISRGHIKAAEEGRHHFKKRKKADPDGFRERLEYKLWRIECLKRADYKCELCEGTKRLHVHHLKCFYKFPDLRLDKNNGQVLCQSCHTKETWKMRRMKKNDK